MVIDDALGIAGGARGVVEGDGIPLVVRALPGEFGIALGDELLVGHSAQQFAALEGGIIDIDHQQWVFHQLQCLADHRRHLTLGDQHLGLGVLQDEGDRRGIQTRIDGVEHCPDHGDAEVGLEMFGQVGAHEGDRVADPDAVLAQCAGQLATAPVGLAPGAPDLAMHDCGLVRIDGCGTFQKGQRAQGLVVGGNLIQVSIVDVV